MSITQLVPAAAPDPAPATHRPLDAVLAVTRDAVHQALAAGTPEADYKAIARLSGHLAAVRGTVYRPAAGVPGEATQLRAACLRLARDAEWAARLLECQLAGEVSAVSRCAASAAGALAHRLDRYWAAEGALVSWVAEQAAPDVAERLARAYRHALRRAPTRPHPRCPRSGPLAPGAWWLAGRWDRLLDTVDSRCGVGQDFRLRLAGSLEGAAQDQAGRPA